MAVTFYLNVNGTDYQLNNRAISATGDFIVEDWFDVFAPRDVFYDTVDPYYGIYRGEQWKPYVITIPLRAFGRDADSLYSVLGTIGSFTGPKTTVKLRAQKGNKSAYLDLQYLDAVVQESSLYSRKIALRFLVMSFWKTDVVTTQINGLPQSITPTRLLIYNRKPTSANDLYSSITANGDIYAIERDYTASYVVVAGGFTSIGGNSCRVARINPDKTIYPLGNASGNGNVYAICSPLLDKTIVGGSFTSLSGVSGRVLEWDDANGWLPIGTYPSTGTIRSIAANYQLSSYNIWAGGEETGSNNRLFVYSGSSWETPTAGGITSGAVTCIEIIDDRVFVGTTNGTIYSYYYAGNNRYALNLSSVPSGIPVRMRKYKGLLYVAWMESVFPISQSGILIINKSGHVLDYIKLPFAGPVINNFDITPDSKLWITTTGEYHNGRLGYFLYYDGTWKLLPEVYSFSSNLSQSAVAQLSDIVFIATNNIIDYRGNIVEITVPGNVPPDIIIRTNFIGSEYVDFCITNHTNGNQIHFVGNMAGIVVRIDGKTGKITTNNGDVFSKFNLIGSPSTFRLEPGKNIVSVLAKTTSNVYFDYTPSSNHLSVLLQ